MNSFKLFNRTNKNDIVSNNLNGTEHKEKDQSKPNHKKNKSNASTSRFHIVKTTNRNNEENKNNVGDNELNGKEEDNKGYVVAVGLSSEKDNQHQITANKESQNELTKKEKNKKLSKKEKRKNKKYKKNKSDNDKRDVVSPTKSNLMETFLHHSSSLSKKDSITGKYTGKQQPIHKLLEAPNKNMQSENLIKNYDEATQYKHEQLDIKEKQGRMGYSSDHTSDTVREKAKFNLILDRPERIESRNIIGINNELSPLTPLTQEDGTMIGKNNESGNDNNTPSSTSLTTPKIVTKESQFKFNFDNDSLLNLTFPVCLGMATPSSPAFSCITPINGAESYNHSLGGEEVDRLLYTNEGYSHHDSDYSSSQNYKLNTMFNTEDKTAENQQNITEQDRSSQPSVEIRTREVPMEYMPKTNDVINNEFQQEKSHKNGKEKQKQKQKMSKHAKKKEKKNTAHLSINTKIDYDVAVSNSSSSLSSPTRGNHNLLSPNSHVSETKKKAWSSFRKLFGKKNGRKSYYRNSLTESIDDNLRGNYATYNSGVVFDWEELRRRMELEENSTVCTESLSAREFAEAVGIPIISSSDEEDDHRLDAESENSISGAARTTNSVYGHTHRSTKSSGPILDMSIFIPPTEEEKKNNFAKRESALSHDFYNASINTTSSFASSTTQDYLDRLGGDLKRKVYEDSHSVSHRELNMFNGSKHSHLKIPDTESLTIPIHRNDHIHEFPNDGVIDDTHFTPSEIDHTSTPISKPLKTKTSWVSTNDKAKPNASTSLNNDITNSNIKRDTSFTESKSVSQREINLKGGINHQTHKSLCSFEMMNKCSNNDVKNRKSCSNISQLEESHAKLISKEPSQKSEGIPSLGRRSPSISSVRSYKTYSPVVKSFKSEDSMVQEFQKGRFTVTKPIYPNSGHRVFIVTKDEEDENGDSITTISSISSSPQKAALRKRSCSQPAAYFSSESDRRVTSSLLKLSTSIPDNDDSKLYRPKDIVINPMKSNSVMTNTPFTNSSDFCSREHHRSNTTSAADYNRRKSAMSFDPYNNSYQKDDLDDSEDNYSEQFSLTKTDSRSEKGKNVPSLYSHDANKSFSSVPPSTSSLTPSPTVSPLRQYKPKKSNSRFQVTYTPGALTPSNNSICSKKSMDSSKIVVNQRLSNEDTSSIEQTPKNCPYHTETETEPNDLANRSSILYNNSFNEENNIGRSASAHSLALSTSANVSSTNYLQQPVNNANQRTIGSISSVLTENGIHSNSSSPALNSAKLSPYHNGIKPLSIITASSVDTNNIDINPHSEFHFQDNNLIIYNNTKDSNNNSNSLHEKSNPLETSSYSIPSPHKILETNSDYFNFFKYNDSYNSLMLSCCSKDNDKSEKETTENILDAMDKTEDNEILSEMEKTNDLSESSPSTPYYHHLSTPMEKPPVIPNSPISYKSISSLNNNNNNNTLEENTSLLGKLPMKGNNSSNESFTIFDRDLNLPGDTSFNEGHSGSLVRQDSKNSSLTTPTLKSSQVVSKNTSSLNMRSNLGHYRSPSTSSTNTNGSSRFTVTRESNDAHSPSYSASKVRRLSNLHSFTPIIADQSFTNDTTNQGTTTTTAPSSKLKPSVVVIQKADEKPIILSGSVTTSTESKNVGRFTVTRETIIQN